MDAIKFPESNVEIAKDQPEYNTLPALVRDSGEVVICWQLSPEEIARINETGQIWQTMLTFGMPLQPQRITTEKSDHFD